MAKSNQHVQCRLRKGTTEMTAWIPEHCAIQDRVVDLDDPEHGEEKGWTVIAVGTEPLDSKWVHDRARDHQKMRGMTDI